MYYKQFSDAQDCYKELMRSLDDAKVDVNKKLLIQKETQKTLVKLIFHYQTRFFEPSFMFL